MLVDSHRSTQAERTIASKHVPKVLKFRTVYYLNKRAIQLNTAKTEVTAVMRCVMHMQLDTYYADSAEVYNTETGELYCVVRRSKSKKIEILYQADLPNGK